MTVAGALAIGIITSLVCFYAVNYLKRLLKIDDSFGCVWIAWRWWHRRCDIDRCLCESRYHWQTTGSINHWSSVGAIRRRVCGYYLLRDCDFHYCKVIQLTMGLRVTDEDEYTGLDLAVHGERNRIDKNDKHRLIQSAYFLYNHTIFI